MILLKNGRFFWLVLLLFLFVIFVLVRAFFIKKNIIDQLSSLKNRKFLLKNFSFVRLIVQSVLFLMAIGLILVALLRPYLPDVGEKVIKHEFTRDIMVAVDISRSMHATDCTPDRLEIVKKKIKQLIHSLGTERIGLIVFSGSAIIQCPLTTDMQAFMLFLDALDTESFSQGTTSIESALKASLEAFQSQSKTKNKLLLLFTDGEDFSSSIDQSIEQAVQSSMTICTFGVGTPEGAPIPCYDGEKKFIGYQKDATGNIVMSRLGEDLLKKIAKQLKGIYVRVHSDDEDDVSVVKNWLLKFEKEKGTENSELFQGRELFMYGAAGAFFLLCLQWIL